jgi:hypothetical protein
LFFAPVTQFDDHFEGAVAVIPPELIGPRYAKLDFVDRALKELKDDINVNCWHDAEHESNAMWSLYADESKGVVICSTMNRMQSAIAPFYFTPQAREPEQLWGGLVRYVDLTKLRLNANGIERFFYKHAVFEFEREFRLAFNLEHARLWDGRTQPEGVRVSADAKLLVERIILGPCLTDQERNQIIGQVKKVRLEDRLATSILLGQPRYI